MKIDAASRSNNETKLFPFVVDAKCRSYVRFKILKLIRWCLKGGGFQRPWFNISLGVQLFSSILFNCSRRVSAGLISVHQPRMRSFLFVCSTVLAVLCQRIYADRLCKDDTAASPMLQLKWHLLCNYDKDVRPIQDHKKSTNVSIVIHIQHYTVVSASNKPVLDPKILIDLLFHSLKRRTP